LASGHRADFERERERADTKRILVTSALPYINGVKHLGNLVGSMLPADVYARFQRQRLGAENVLFICATDEHGTPAELAALEEGKSVQDYCDHWHAEQKRLYEAFHLSFDYFGRSSSAQNRALTQDFAKTETCRFPNRKGYECGNRQSSVR
jgi:methionyl-tRNA synthetase